MKSILILGLTLLAGACAPTWSAPTVKSGDSPPLAARVSAEAAAPALNVKDFGAFGDGLSHPLTEKDLQSRTDLGAYRVGDEWDTVAIQEAVRLATPDKQVYLPEGIYLVFRDVSAADSGPGRMLVLKPDLRLTGRRATLRPAKGESLTLRFPGEQQAPLSNVTLEGITFENIRVVFQADRQASLRKVAIRNCAFRNGSEIPGDQESAGQLTLSRTSDFTVEACAFSRDAAHPGTALRLYKSHGTRILNSTWDGHLVTAINVFGIERKGDVFPDEGRNLNILIEGNQISRAPGDYREDHGIYAWGMKGLTVVKNRIRGFSLSAKGGSLKVRNGEDVLVRDNDFEGSGILLYTYDVGYAPRYLRRVLITGNRFRIDAPAVADDSNSSRLRPAVSYWRNFASDAEIEQDIRIERNVCGDASIFIANPAHGPAFTVSDNEVKELHIRPALVGKHNNKVQSASGR